MSFYDIMRLLFHQNTYLLLKPIIFNENKCKRRIKRHLCPEVKRRRGLLRKCIFRVRVQAAISGFQTFYWSSRTASPQLIQWTVRINRFWQLGSVHKIHIHLVATSPLGTFRALRQPDNLPHHAAGRQPGQWKKGIIIFSS